MPQWDTLDIHVEYVVYGVGINSVLCVTCNKWIHRRCSGVRRCLTKVQNFECIFCKTGGTNPDDVEGL